MLIVYVLGVFSKHDVPLLVMINTTQNWPTAKGIHIYEQISKQFLADQTSPMRILENQ